MDNEIFVEYGDIIIEHLARFTTITSLIFVLLILVVVFLVVYWFLSYIKGFFMP